MTIVGEQLAKVLPCGLCRRLPVVSAGLMVWTFRCACPPLTVSFALPWTDAIRMWNGFALTAGDEIPDSEAW